jgi:hypothetical protein
MDTQTEDQRLAMMDDRHLTAMEDFFFSMVRDGILLNGVVLRSIVRMVNEIRSDFFLYSEGIPVYINT